MLIAIGIFMAVMGAGIAGIWTKDILFNPDIDLSKGFFQARDKESGGVFWLHWLAEYSTAAALLVGAVGLFVGASWALGISFIALGALSYTSINSLAWAFAKSERLPYSMPMLFGAIGGISSIIALLIFSN